MTAEEVRAVLEKDIATAGSARAWAAKHGVSTPYISDVRKGNREPGSSILAALGLEKIVIYQPIAEQETANGAQGRQ